MASSIHKMLWGAFAALTILVVAGLALTLLVLQTERREESRIVGSEPLIDAVQEMDGAITTAVAASRGYVLTHYSEFTQAYGDAVRDFDKNYAIASQAATEPLDIREVNDFKRHFDDISPLMNKLVDSDHDIATDTNTMLEV